MQNPIKDISFFEAGYALFTVSNNKGEHYTYKIRKKADKPHFVYLKSAKANENGWAYTYLGVYVPSKHQVVITRASRLYSDDTRFRVLQWAITTVSERKPLPEGYAIQHEGRCCRCGRTLTDPESIESGIGPECTKKLGRHIHNVGKEEAQPCLNLK